MCSGNLLHSSNDLGRVVKNIDDELDKSYTEKCGQRVNSSRDCTRKGDLIVMEKFSENLHSKVEM